MTEAERSNMAMGVLLGGLLPIGLAALLTTLRHQIDSANMALILVVVVVAAAAVGGRWAALIAAVVSAMSFDFFLTRPYLSLRITSGDDVETAGLLLTVGLVVGTIASWARREHQSAVAGRAEVRRIRAVAERVVSGAEPEAVIQLAQDELRDLLGLRECRFEALPYETRFPRLERNGTIAPRSRQLRYVHGGFELPPEGFELEVLTRGHKVGRFVCLPQSGVGVSLEQRVVAVALVDQVGGTFAAPVTPGKPLGN